MWPVSKNHGELFCPRKDFFFASWSLLLGRWMSGSTKRTRAAQERTLAIAVPDSLPFLRTNTRFFQAFHRFRRLELLVVVDHQEKRTHAVRRFPDVAVRKRLLMLWRLRHCDFLPTNMVANEGDFRLVCASEPPTPQLPTRC